MSLSRKLLESLGLEADKVSTIIDAHAETVDALKSQIETYKADAEKYQSTRKELDLAQSELESLKTSGGDWQKKYEAEHSEFEAFKADQSAKDLKANKVEAYKGLLRETGVSDKIMDKIIKVTDFNSIELEDGAIKDKDSITESIKSEWADFIVTQSAQGAQTATPPAGNGLQTYSHEDIAKMTPAEINQNWESIKLSMKGNE